MATDEEKTAGYGGRYAQGFQLYVKLSQEHKAILQCLDYVLTGGEFDRIGAGKSHLHVLGVGSGAGEIDTHVLSVLHSSFPDVPIAEDVVEPSTELTEQFKALLATLPQLQNIPLAWHTMSCAEYEKKVQGDAGETKRFDLIHMVQMLYYVDDYAGTIKFFHSLLKKDGKLLIVHEGANTGWDILWKTYRKELCSKTISDYLSAGDIKVHLKSMGLQYVERIIPNTLDITECFVEGSEVGELLLDFMTEQDHFHRSLTPELRAGILDLMRNKCSTVKDGRVLFDCSLSCIVISA